MPSLHISTHYHSEYFQVELLLISPSSLNSLSIYYMYHPSVLIIIWSYTIVIFLYVSYSIFISICKV